MISETAEYFQWLIIVALLVVIWILWCRISGAEKEVRNVRTYCSELHDSLAHVKDEYYRQNRLIRGLMEYLEVEQWNAPIEAILRPKQSKNLAAGQPAGQKENPFC